MTSQSFFYITTSSAIILLALLFIVLVIIIIVIAVRIAKIFRNIAKTSEEVSQTAKTLREKIKISALMGLFTQGLKEIILFVKEKREEKEEKKKKKK